MARILAVIFYAAASLQARAMIDEAPSQLGFGYCSPPVVPRCIDGDGRHSGARVGEPCSREVLRFTQTLGAYRLCLARESERAIGTGNDAIARFRCRSQGLTRCR